MAHPRKQTSLAAAAVAIPFSQKLVLAIKAYLKNDVLDRRPSFDQEEDLSQIRFQSVEMASHFTLVTIIEGWVRKPYYLTAEG